VVSSGSKFQTRGPATLKARLPTVESLTGGTRRRLVLAVVVVVVVVVVVAVCLINHVISTSMISGTRNVGLLHCASQLCRL